MLAIEPSAELLTSDGIERLSADRSPWMRAQTAATVAVLFVEGTLNEREKIFAVSILEVFAHDLENQVREALSEHVKHCARLPHSIAQKLARDVESVALPIIRYSSVLDEVDLISIARDGGTVKQIAVAQRDNVASVVSDILVDTRSPVVIRTLLANETSEVSEKSYGKILTDFDQDEKIQALMVERPALPATIVARMVLKVSDTLRQRLIDRFDLPESMAEELTAQARERALIESLGQITTGDTMESLSLRLLDEGTLTPTFLLRALCTGQLRLFTAAIAARAGITAGSADELILDGGQRGLMALYVHAGLPGNLMPAFRIALDIVREKKSEGPRAWNNADTQKILSQLIATYDDLAPGHLESVLAQLGRFCTDNANAA